MASPSRLLTGLVALVVLAGCDATVDTSIAVDEATTDVTVAVRVTGAAAESLAADPAAEAEVLAVFTELTGQAPEPDRAGGAWSAQVSVPLDVVPAASGFTGVAAVARAGSGSETAVTVTFTDPVRLMAAFDAAVAGRPDALDARAALGAATVLSVTVAFPGGVSATPEVVGGLAVERSGTTATVRFSVDEAPVNERWAVTGDPARPMGRPWWAYAVAASAVGAGVWLVFGRRHQRGASR